MSKYIDFVAKVIHNKSNRKTRKRGGAFTGTDCDFTPLTEDVTRESLQEKIRKPIPSWNLQFKSSKSMSGSFNIAKEVECKSIQTNTKKKRKRKKKEVDTHVDDTSELIVCRVLKKTFYIGDYNGSSIVLEANGTDSNNTLNLFATELTTTIHHSRHGNTLPIYDIQAISIDNSLLSFLSKEEKEEVFELDTNTLEDVPPYVCLCIVMKKGDPYEITFDNFGKTMDLFDKIAATEVCIDVKPGNLLCSNGEVFMIDFDPNFIKETRDENFSKLTDPQLFGSCMMKYLFCMFLIIYKHRELTDERTGFKDSVLKKLDEIMDKELSTDTEETFPFLFIISSYYNSSHRVGNPKFFFTGGFEYKNLIDNYHWRWLMDHKKRFKLPLYIDVRRYLVNCELKALYDGKCVNNKGKYTVKYDHATQSLLYYINLPCSTSITHSISSIFGHKCLKEIEEIDITLVDKNRRTFITFSYLRDGIEVNEDIPYFV